MLLYYLFRTFLNTDHMTLMVATAGQPDLCTKVTTNDNDKKFKTTKLQASDLKQAHI